MNKENNLIGVATIASGLTSSAVSEIAGSGSLVNSSIIFDEKTGQGSFGEILIPDTYTTGITGKVSNDAVYRPDLTDGTVHYSFSKDTTIAPEKGPGINITKTAENDVVIDAAGKTLTVASTGSPSQAINLTTGKKITVDAAALNVSYANEKGNGTAVNIQASYGAWNKDPETMEKNGAYMIDIKGNANVTAEGNTQSIGMKVAGGGTIHVAGDLNMKKDDSYGISTANKPTSFRNAAGLYSSGSASQDAYGKGQIIVDGKSDIWVKGTGLITSGDKGYITLGSGNVIIERDEDTAYYAMAAEGGHISMNTKTDDKGVKSAATDGDVTVKGNLLVADSWLSEGQGSTIDLWLGTKDSSWTGAALSNFTAASSGTGSIDLGLTNGAVWTNEQYGKTEFPRTGPDITPFDGSHITHLYGGSDGKSAGIIEQKDENAITIDNYKGYSTVYYAHDAASPASLTGGDVKIGHAESGSQITMMTASDGVTDANQEEVLGALAQKLWYLNYVNKENNLTGVATIASGLTSSSVSEIVGSGSKLSGQIAFDDKTGRGSYNGIHVEPDKPDKPDKPDQPDQPSDDRFGQGYYEENSAGRGENIPTVGDYETYMMKGTRMAVMSSLLSWRDMAQDVLSRTKSLREDPEQEGIWAKTYGGKFSYDGASAFVENSYWAGQVGFEKSWGSWHMGGALEYRDGSSDYLYGGSGQDTVYSFGAYGTKDLGSGSYVDVAAKAGRLTNKFTVYNEIGQRLKGEYDADGYSLAAQYGKRITHGDTYIEPQAQITWARVGKSTFGGNTTTASMQVNQGAWDSLVGRVGIEAGYKADWGALFGRFSVFHEFGGDLDSSYYAKDGGWKHTSFDMDGTWEEITLGGRFRLAGSTQAYADVTRSFGGDYESQWKINAGLRIPLGSGSAPGEGRRGMRTSASSASQKTIAVPGVAEKAVRGPIQSAEHGYAYSEKTAEAAEAVTGTSILGTAAAPVQTVAQSPAASNAAAPETAVKAAAPAPAAGEGQVLQQKQNASAAGTTAGTRTVTTVAETAPAGTAYSGAPSVYNDGNSYVLSPVVVTANRASQTILEAKADISVVTRKEIEEMHMDTVEEALRTVPGVQFLNYGANGINANLSGIRLNGSKDVLILVDGVRINDFMGSGQSGYAYTSLLNGMDNIERIEVLRGGGGVAYGSGAKGGVINIITRKIDRTQTTLDMAAGNFGKRNYNFRTEGKVNGFLYSAFYNKEKVGEQKDGDGLPIRGFTDWKTYGAKVGYEFSDNHTLTVDFTNTDSSYAGEDMIYKGIFNGIYKTKSVTLRDQWRISDHWDNSFAYRSTDTKSRYTKPFGEGDAHGTIGLPFNVFSDYSYDFISNQLHYRTDRHDLVMGIEYSKAKNNIASKVQNGSMAKRYMDNLSFFAQDDWKVLSWLTLSAGVRHDRPEGDKYQPKWATHTAKSYKISMDITDRDSIWAGRNDFYIMPGVNQLYDSQFGNSGLKPAEGQTDTIGYSHQFNDDHYININWFNTKSDQTVGMDINGVWQNGKEGVSRGWNAEYTAHLNENWDLKLGWAHLYEYTDADPNYSFGYSPKDVGTIGIYYNKDKFSAAFDGFYFMRRTNIFYHEKEQPQAGPGWPSNNYGVFNLSFNYRPNKNLMFYLKGENIFNKLWAEHTDVIWNKVPGSWYSMPGRSFMAGVQYTF